MSDLVKRLRDAANKSVMDFGEHWNLEDEAADAIERKDAAIAELVQALKKLQYAYRQAAGLHDPNTGDAFTFVSHNAIAKYDK